MTQWCVRVRVTACALACVDRTCVDVPQHGSLRWDPVGCGSACGQCPLGIAGGAACDVVTAAGVGACSWHVSTCTACVEGTCVDVPQYSRCATWCRSCVLWAACDVVTMSQRCGYVWRVTSDIADVVTEAWERVA